MCKDFKTWVKDNKGIEVPEGSINGSWFEQNNLPMIVACTCCDMTMSVASVKIDDDGCCYCSNCAPD